MDRNIVHEPVAEATFSVFKDAEGSWYLEIDTYGSATRKMPGKKSQSIQFGPDTLAQLKAILQDLQEL